MIEEYMKPSRLPLWTALIVVGGLAAMLLFAILPGFRLKLYQSAFEDIREKDTVERVIELMGEADEDVPPMPQLEVWWGKKATAGRDVEDFKRVLTWQVRVFHKTVTWQVAFDAAGRAIAKHRFDS